LIPIAFKEVLTKPLDFNKRKMNQQRNDIKANLIISSFSYNLNNLLIERWKGERK
jgi:hypothetical protein